MTAPSPLRRVPGTRRIVLHRAGGRSAARTRMLAGASDWRRRLVDRTAFASVAVTGPRLLPPAPRWPWPDVDAGELEAALRREFTGLRLLGAVLPRQAGRCRLSVLCQAAGNPLIVKFDADEPALRAEHRSLELLAVAPLPAIATPRPFGVGTILAGSGRKPVAFLATSALGLDAQRPAIDAPLHTFEVDLATRLADLPRPDGTPSTAVPVHGDLTPWNLRRTRRGLALFDWEAAGWGPPGSDVAHYRRASAEVRPWWYRPGGSR